ncbi:MAG: tRNA (adenosine(37)-N6)-dimethylallyltransferase MiaA [Caldimicrobium sp.]
MKQKVVVLCGPTGVGKTEVSIELAKEFKGEIVNFDSQQFYKELIIGTAKPLPEDRKGVPHHLFEEISILEEMNAHRFIKLADEKVAGIWQRSNLPILVGGTGLYLRVFEYGLFEVKIKQGLREELKKRAEKDLEGLYEELKKKDPLYAKKIHPHDKVRILRALEVIYSTGEPFSKLQGKTPFFGKKRYSLLKIGLYLPKEELYTKIEKRVIKMVERGWLKEVEDLKKRFGSEIFAKIKAIGYRELLEVLEGKINLEDAIKKIQKKSKEYAKRQLTWFKKEKDIQWFQPKELEKIKLLVREFLVEG